MTNLTEQWNKGKLPDGDYYIKRRNGYTLYDNIDSHGVWRNSTDDEISEVLAQVPSYDQWQKHRRTLLKTQEKNCDLEIINKQLKELLKECRDKLDTYYEPTVKKINQVLGEE